MLDTPITPSRRSRRARGVGAAGHASGATAGAAVRPRRAVAGVLARRLAQRCGARGRAADRGRRHLRGGVDAAEGGTHLRARRRPGSAACAPPVPAASPSTTTSRCRPSYDPARRWPLRVQLHGGVDRQNPEEGRRRRANRLPGGDAADRRPPVRLGRVGVVARVRRSTTSSRCVDRVKRQYNVDESQHLSDRHLGWRHRRVLPGDARADAVVGGAAAHRPPRRAGQSLHRRRRRAVRVEPGEPAVLRRQRHARSAVPGGARRAVSRGARHGRRRR